MITCRFKENTVWAPRYQPGNTQVYGDMIFSKMCFVVTCAHSASLEILKSCCKVPRWFSQEKPSVALQNFNQNKQCVLSHIHEDCVIGFPQKPYGYKSWVTSIFDKRPSTPKKALALSDRHLKYILYTVFESHNCRFVSMRSSSNDIVAKNIHSQQVRFAETHLEQILINFHVVIQLCYHAVWECSYFDR